MSWSNKLLVRINDISLHSGKIVEIRGWLYNKRSSGKLHFLQIRDGSGTIQCVVYQGDVSPDDFETCGKIGQESSIIVFGEVKPDDRSDIGFEIGVTTVKLIHESLNYPITPKDHGVSFLLDKRHLWLRSSRPHAILKIRDEISRACRDFMHKNEFTLIDAPIFTPAACEGTSTLFETDYFDQKAYLTQSGQLYMEAAAMAFGNVYCFGPTFRAEKSKTRRHLTEFWMIEPEMAYCDLQQDMIVAEQLVYYVIRQVLSNRSNELELLGRDLLKLEKITLPFPRVSYDEAVKKLQQLGSDIQWGSDLGGDDETILTKEFDTPILVHRYPKDIKAFYMKGDPDDERCALCVDMLAPEGYGEIIGGGQREDNYNILENKITQHNLPKESFEWFLDLRSYGSVEHAGFGMGIERVVSWLCGIQHVRETIPFPRMIQRLYP
ncbi:MAG: asparagine--tRNA ligase [Candidatus Latescibacterota bacterium]|nr:asparagine--tRNA ligase [Candidatus Latescibacterota bacterium]